MKLLVISHTPHSRKDGALFGWAPTVNELNFIRPYFSEMVHIAPMEGSDVPDSYSSVSPAITLVPTINRGGSGILPKLKVMVDSIGYCRLIVRHVQRADLVHVRCPANISLVALIVLLFFPNKAKWIKYAGDWERRRNNPFSYRLQRFIARRLLSRHFVTINSIPKNEPPFIYHFYNPSYFRSELDEAGRSVAHKSVAPNKWVALFVGGLTSNKGPEIVVEALAGIFPFFPGRLFLIGDGEMKDGLDKLIRTHNVESMVSIEGWKSREHLKDYYRQAHFILLPSQGEGWPKVVSEAMAYGVIPVVSDVSALSDTLKKFNTGIAIRAYDPLLYRDALLDYLRRPEQWQRESANAKKAAQEFSMEEWWARLERMIHKHFKSDNGTV